MDVHAVAPIRPAIQKVQRPEADAGDPALAAEVMDAIRSAEVPAPTGPSGAAPDVNSPQPGLRAAAASKPTRVALFSDIAVGDAP